MPVKVHRSALCIIPPSTLWQPIQSIRAVHDKSFARWMPHINLLYPFYSDDVNADAFLSAANTAAAALQTLPPFTVSLNNFRCFRHARSVTVWLEPEPDAALQALYHALVAVFPDCDDLSNDPRRKITRFTPHLSVGQWSTPAAAVEAMEHLQAAWEVPVEFTVDSVALISRTGQNSPFSLRFKVPLGGEGSGRVREVNEVYAEHNAAD